MAGEMIWNSAGKILLIIYRDDTLFQHFYTPTFWLAPERDAKRNPLHGKVSCRIVLISFFIS